MRKQLLKIAVILLCVLGLWAGKGRFTAYAKAEQPTASLSGNVAMLEKEDMGYVMQVTAGRCNGLSYGCLYTCAEMEGGGGQEQSASLPIALRQPCCFKIL